MRLLQNHVIFSVFMCACYGYTAGPVSKITKCRRDDFECIAKSADEFSSIFIAGLPEYGVPTLDPLIFDELDASSPNLKVKFQNLVMTGTKTCKINKMEIKANKWLGQCTCDLKYDGGYEMDGRLLVIPIKGKGQTHVELNQALITVTAEPTEVTGKDGKKHWKFTNWTYSYKLLGKPVLKLDHLFDDNKQLRQAIEDLLKNNSEALLEEMGTPLFKIVAGKIKDYINKFFKSVPLEDLILD